MRSLRILILRVGAMGDVLHALPAVAALRRIRPDWRIDWVVDPRWAPLLAGLDGKGPVVTRLHIADTKLWSNAPTSKATLMSIRELGRSLRKEHYDLVLDMQGTLRSSVIGRMAKAAEFGGYSDPREALALRFYRQRYTRKGAHVVDQGAALLSDACGLPLVPGAIELPHDPEADAWAKSMVSDKQVCILAPSAGWAAKQWPAERFAELAKELDAAGMDVIVNAVSNDDPLAARIVEESGGAARPVSPGIPGLVALVRLATLFIGGDSGPTHLAAALEVPTVALFGPTDPQRNGPRGPGPCRILRHATSVTSYRHVDDPDLGLARITVQTVIGAAGNVLSEANAARDAAKP